MKPYMKTIPLIHADMNMHPYAFFTMLILFFILLVLPAPTLAEMPPLPSSNNSDAPADLSKLFKAVRLDDILGVETMLEKSGSELVLSTNRSGMTLLHLAAAMNNREMAGFLINRGASLEAATTSGFTPLHWAAARDAVETVRLLIELGADIHTATTNAITPLHWAASRNAINVMKLLIDAGAHVGNTTDNGFTPLDWAVREDAHEAAVALAFKMVSDEMDEEGSGQRADPSTGTSTVVSLALPDKSTAQNAYLRLQTLRRQRSTGHTRSKENTLPRPSWGTSLTIPIGFNENLVFLWIEDLKLWVGKYEITNGQYKRFDPGHKSMFYESFSLEGINQPVVYVSWTQTRAFCDWLNRNFLDRVPLNCAFRLPTEVEWIAFARCGDSRTYPWGNKWPPLYGNYSDLTAKEKFAAWNGIKGYKDGYAVTCPVFDSGANEWGIHGLAGNVWEWCEDWYDASKQYKVRHGGSWDFDEEPSLHIQARGFDRPKARYDTIGFRVVLGKEN